MLLSKYLSFLSVCLLISLNLQAQFMDYGADPSRFKWNIVRLPHYNLIYPQGTDTMAYRYALYLENAYPHIQKTIGKPMKATFPVILHPANMISNGMVSWAPRRMELITTPSSDLTQSWDKHLVLHESRHIFQTGKVMHGIFKPLYYLIGEQAAGVASFFLPTWFLEGDAVGTETGLSNSGRGRLPEFNMPYRAQMLGANTFYSFDKWLLGSYKDYTSTFYALGYNLTSFARQQYGADIWDKTTSRYVRNLLFANSFKHYTKSGFKKLYKDTYSYLRQEWEKLDTDSARAPTYLSPHAKTYTSYRYPQTLNDSMLIAVKSGLKDINSLVLLTNGKEKRLTYMGNINSRLSLRNGRVYWTEIVPGIRWTHENHSVLKCYDIETKNTRTITPRQRYLAPSIDESGSTAIVSRSTLAGENQLVLIQLEDGKELAVYSVPGNAFVKELTFGEARNVIAVAVTDTGISLLQLNIETSQWHELLNTTSINITSPIWKDGKIVFESGANGTNNIYCLNPIDSTVVRLTAARFGAFDPVFSTTGNQLLFSDYQAKGYRIASIPTDSLLTEKSNLATPTPTPFAQTLAQQEQYNLDSATLEPINFHPERYRKGLHTFKIHSWAPFYYDVTEAMNAGADDLSTIVKPGVMMLSQNTLNTAIMQAGWYYLKGENHGKVSFAYQGWFPKFDLTADYGGKAFSAAWEKNETGQSTIRNSYAGRNLLVINARIYLPFNLTGGQRIRGIQPMLTYSFTNNKYQQFNSGKFRNFQYILPEVLFYNYRRLAQRDILPRTGYQLRLQYLNTPLNTENYGSLYAARLTTYWPGIVRNQGLMLRFGYQYQELESKALYMPKRLLDATRGYNDLYQTRQQLAFKADYTLSLLSPDLSIGSIIYIRRLRANLFYDLTRNQANKQSGWSTYSSYGTDLVFDWNVLLMSYPLTTGVRLIKPIDYGKFQAEMLFSISF